METTKKSGSRTKSDYLTLQDLLHLCLGNWPWFLLSLAICLGIAEYRILRTVPMYTRTASLLIKEKGKANKSLAADAGTSIDTGIFSFSTNIANEVFALQAPDLVLEVVKRLNLDIDYQVDGAFHSHTLYGSTLPVKVAMDEVSANGTCTFDITFKDDKSMVLSNFRHYGEDVSGGKSLTTAKDKTVKTPVGHITIEATPYFDDTARPGMTIHVSRIPAMAAMGGCCGRLSAELLEEGASIINLRYRDVNTQRAEDVLNTVIAVYNENWVKDKNQIAVSTSVRTRSLRKLRSLRWRNSLIT